MCVKNIIFRLICIMCALRALMPHDKCTLLLLKVIKEINKTIQFVFFFF